MISVIIPTFNRAGFLRDAAASVAAQRDMHDRVELIVVDDGSTDDIPGALSSTPADVIYIRQERAGVSAARNRGIIASRGEWIAFLDSDDLWLPGKLAAQMDFFRDNPAIPLCQTEEIWIRNGLRINPKRYHKKPEGRCFELLLERCLVSPSAVVLHRRLFDTAGLFDESLPACEDYDLWLRIGCRFSLGLVPEPLVMKRGGHADQLSATIPALDRYRIQSIANLLRSGILDADQTAAAKRVLRAKSAIYAKGCRNRGNNAEACRIEALMAH